MKLYRTTQGIIIESNGQVLSLYTQGLGQLHQSGQPLRCCISGNKNDSSRQFPRKKN